MNASRVPGRVWVTAQSKSKDFQSSAAEASARRGNDVVAATSVKRFAGERS